MTRDDNVHRFVALILHYFRLAAFQLPQDVGDLLVQGLLHIAVVGAVSGHELLDDAPEGVGPERGVWDVDDLVVAGGGILDDLPLGASYMQMVPVQSVPSTTAQWPQLPFLGAVQ